MVNATTSSNLIIFFAFGMSREKLIRISSPQFISKFVRLKNYHLPTVLDFDNLRHWILADAFYPKIRWMNKS